MSSLVFYDDGFSHKRHQRHKQINRVEQTKETAITPLPISKHLSSPKVNKLAIVIGITSLSVHLALSWYFYSQPKTSPVVLDTPPITVELYKPPVEPPKPLEQKKELPPPVLKKEPILPAVKLPAPPPPIASPVAETSAPVVAAVEAPPAPVEPAPVIETPPPAPEPLIQPSAKAAYLNNPAPVYPEFAQDQGWEGQVVLRVHVSTNGKANVVQVKRSSGKKILDESALQAVQRWSFVPARRGQTPVEGWVDVPIDFKISG